LIKGQDNQTNFTNLLHFTLWALSRPSNMIIRHFLLGVKHTEEKNVYSGKKIAA